MECSQTDRHTDTQTETDFIICPMLYAIAMGQISVECSPVRDKQAAVKIAVAASNLPVYSLDMVQLSDKF